MLKRVTVTLATIALLVASLVSTAYAARDTQLMYHWHPMFIQPAFQYFGLYVFGHDHPHRPHPVRNGAFVSGPVTICWNYDFLEKDCDGPDHYKAFVSDGTASDSRIGAYKGDPWASFSPSRAKACGMNGERVYCVSDYRDDGEIVWRETGHNLESHTLAIGCPGPRLELCHAHPKTHERRRLRRWLNPGT